MPKSPPPDSPPPTPIIFEKVRRYSTEDRRTFANQKNDRLFRNTNSNERFARQESKDPKWHARPSLQHASPSPRSGILGWLVVAGLILAWLEWTPLVNFIERLFR
jgi:hypothetical protein